MDFVAQGGFQNRFVLVHIHGIGFAPQLDGDLCAIDRAIDGLPMIVKATFLYSQLDGLSYVAIAQKLGLSERTVSRYMKQALRQCYLSEASL